MDMHLLQNIIAADDQSLDKIQKIVPLIIFFVIWIVAAISKVAKNAQKQSGQGEQKPAQPKRQPDFDDIAKVIRERYAAAKKVKEAEQGTYIPPQAVPSRPKPQPPPMPKMPAEEKQPAAPVEPRSLAQSPYFDSLPASEQHIPEKFTPAETFVPLTEQQPSDSFAHIGSAEAHTNPYLSDLVKQYSDTDGLRKAILGYEIFGKPLALREQDQ